MKVKATIILSLVIASLFSGIPAHSQELGILEGNTNTSGVLILKEKPSDDEPIHLILMKAENQECIAAHGTRARAIERRDYGLIKNFWTKIEMLDRNCAGKTGWVLSNDFKFQ